MNRIITKFISGSLSTLLIPKMNKLFLLFFFLVSLNTFGQYATKHYIAPAPWNYSSSANEFIVSTVSPGTISVTVTKSNGTAITTMNVTSGTPAVYRPSNSTHPVSAFGANVVNTVYNDRGLIFTSASPIAVSIRNVESDSYSSGIPSYMKGNAALASYGNEGSGTTFRVGYYRSNFSGLVAQGAGAIAAPVYSVMAIKNNTVVSKDGVALVTLQAGQSYLFQTPIGSLITSTKPVVMNSGSWQDAPGGCGDGVFDQIPPNRVLGRNYLVVRGSGTAGTGTNLPEQTLFIATEDNTTVTATNYNVSGAVTGTTTYTLATAGSYKNIFHGNAATAYTATTLVANKNIVVYSGTAQSCEVDMSCLPPIGACSGSFKVETKRFLAADNTTVLPYFGYALINDPTAIVNINGTNLETLGGVRRQLGTSGYYLIDFTNIQLGNPNNLVFTSTVRMSVSMVQQGAGYSMAAYLSSFNDTLTPIDAELDGSGCVTLLTAEPGVSPYQWYYNGILIPGATSQTYQPTGPGNYSVSGTRTCGLTAPSTEFVVDCVPINAIDDGTSILPFATVISGSTLSTSVKANDLLANVLVTNTNTIVTPGSQGPLTIDSFGIITVAPGTPNGVYSIQYQLCTTQFFPTVCDLATAYVKVAVLPGSIAASHTICSGGNPDTFTSVSPGLGGSPVTSYRWESSVSPFNSWNPIAGSNSDTYDAPAGLTDTTQYRRIAVTLLGESDPTTPVTVTTNPLPTVFSLTGGGTYCLGGTAVSLGLDNSTIGINYQLQLNGVNDGAVVAGTGSAISFGNKTVYGTYTVIATNSTTNCTATMTGNANITICSAGNVWYDANLDGIIDAGENGLQGATVTLDPGTPTNTADDTITTTDSSGNYLFINLPAGNYNISVNYTTITGGLPLGVNASQLAQTFDTDGISTANISTVTLSTLGTSVNQKFGYIGLSSIGDLVWYDTNGDGIKDLGENGLAGATITLDPGTPGNTADDITTITDASGNYLFSNLVFGTYTVSVEVSTITAGIPSGYNSSQLVPTFDADSVGTPLKSTIVLGYGQNNLDQDFAFVKPSDSTTGGFGGGVESESLGDAISKIYVGRKKNSEPTEFVKSSKNLYDKSKIKSRQNYKGKEQTLIDMFPKELVAGNIANETSPTDILDYTIADQVLAVDFSIAGKTKAVVLGIKTTDKIYNHTKASCDRLRGAEILNIQKIKLQGYTFLMQGIKQRNGVVEYAISFAVAKNKSDTNYSIQTNWYVNAYTKFNDVYNFQVWSTRPADTQKLVSDILNNLKSYLPVNLIGANKIPETYASKVYREKGELIVKLRSTKVGNTAEISMEELYSETANNIKFRNNTLTTAIKQELRVNIADGYEYDGLVKVNSQVEDAFYHADGNWGMDFDKKYTKINNYFVWNNFNRKYLDEEYSIDRNFEIKATTDDYLTVYKSLLPGTLSADYSEYNYVAFTAKGSGLTELGLVKSSIEDWKSQYRIMVDLTKEEQTYYIPFDAFISASSKASMTAEDLTTLTFTFLPLQAKTKELDMLISNVKFVKVAGNDGIVIKKQVKFDNSLLAYPNPSNGKVNLMLFSNNDTNATITLSDLLGRTVYKSSTDLKVGRNELDFNLNVTPGTYIVKVYSKDTEYGASKIIFR